MKTDHVALPMEHFLQVVQEHTVNTRDVLLAQGYHANVIWAKADKAGRKGYISWGVVMDRPWLTEKGEAFLRGELQS